MSGASLLPPFVILSGASLRAPTLVILSGASLRAQSKDLTVSHADDWEILRRLRMTGVGLRMTGVGLRMTGVGLRMTGEGSG
jgi:hypothetical protein